MAAVASALLGCGWYLGLGKEVGKQYRWLHRLSAEGPIVWSYRAARRAYISTKRTVLGARACDSPPLAPTAVGASKREVVTVRLKWLPNLPNDLTQEVYEVHVAPVAESVPGESTGENSPRTPRRGPEWVRVCAKAEEAEYLLRGLHGGRLYRVRVRATNSVGASDWCEGTFRTKLFPVEGGARGPLQRHAAMEEMKPPIRSYSWTQATKLGEQELGLRIRLPDGTRGKMLDVHVRKSTVEVLLLRRPILSGEFWGEVCADDVEWTIEDVEEKMQEEGVYPAVRRELRVVLNKVAKGIDVEAWPCLVKGHPEVATEGLKVEAARARAAELDGGGEGLVKAMLQQMGEAGALGSDEKDQ